MQDDQHKRKQAMMVAPSAEFAAKTVQEALAAAPHDPLDLSDAEIAAIGREAGYTLSGWAERLEAYVKQARRNGVLR